MKVRDDVNESGIPVTWFKCEFCDSEFSVCPAVEGDKLDDYKGCTTPECKSYDPSRDLDILWMSDKELANHHKVIDMKMLKKRRDFREGKDVFKATKAKTKPIEQNKED